MFFFFVEMFRLTSSIILFRLEPGTLDRCEHVCKVLFTKYGGVNCTQNYGACLILPHD